MSGVETLGARLLRARMGYGLRLDPPRVVTQLEVAKELGVSGVAVGGWEADRNEPGLDNLRAIARFYRVRLGWLLEGELPMWSEPPDEGEQGAKNGAPNGNPRPRHPVVETKVQYLDPRVPTQPSRAKPKAAPKKPGRSAVA